MPTQTAGQTMNTNLTGMPTMKDEQLLNDALLSQKYITFSYNTFANECVNPEARNEFLNILNEEHQIQADVFTKMQQKGWYQTNPADQQQISNAKQKFQNS